MRPAQPSYHIFDSIHTFTALAGCVRIRISPAFWSFVTDTFLLYVQRVCKWHFLSSFCVILFIAMCIFNPQSEIGLQASSTWPFLLVNEEEKKHTFIPFYTFVVSTRIVRCMEPYLHIKHSFSLCTGPFVAYHHRALDIPIPVCVSVRCTVAVCANGKQWYIDTHSTVYCLWWYSHGCEMLTI